MENIKQLNEAQQAFDSFEGGDSAAVCNTLRALRPYGYIAEHEGGEFFRVFNGSGCLTPLKAVSEEQAIELAIEHRIQLEVRFNLGNRKWTA